MPIHFHSLVNDNPCLTFKLQMGLTCARYKRIYKFRLRKNFIQHQFKILKYTFVVNFTAETQEFDE